jgi:glycerol uptake facilitator-like aquaporin
MGDIFYIVGEIVAGVLILTWFYNSCKNFNRKKLTPYMKEPPHEVKTTEPEPDFLTPEKRKEFNDLITKPSTRRN